MKKFQVLILTLFLYGITLSCKQNFLDVPPIGSFAITDLTTGTGINSAVVSAYASLHGREPSPSIGPFVGSYMTYSPANILFGSIRGGQGHKGSTLGDSPTMTEVEQAAMTTNNTSVNMYFTYYYNAIDKCNLVLKLIPQVPTSAAPNNSSGITDAERKQIIAEMRFLRAHFYFQLVTLFKNIPWIDETVNADLANPDEVKVPNTDQTGKYVTVWSNIEKDFAFAAQTLAVTNSEWGRPNSWAAKAYHAKTLLYMTNAGEPGASYSAALTEMTDVRVNGKRNNGAAYALLTNYRDNYNADIKNGANSEWVWGVQHIVNDGTPGITAPNGMQDAKYIGTVSSAGANSPGFGRGYGFFTASSWFVNKFSVDAKGLPILDNVTRNADPVNNSENTIPYVVEPNPVDPRLDWTVTRQGIPFYDFGLAPGATWSRDPSSAGTVQTKKYYIWKKDDGKYVPAGGWFTAINIPVIRYADVLLMCAELEARTSDLANAALHVNQVRARMATNTASPDHYVKTYAPGSTSSFTTTNAANYSIGQYPAAGFPFDNQKNALKAIFMERNLELGLEGLNGFDLVRFGQADPGFDVDEMNAYFAYESTTGKRAYLTGAQYTAIPDQLAPITQQAIDFSFRNGVSTLKQNPGY